MHTYITNFNIVSEFVEGVFHCNLTTLIANTIDDAGRALNNSQRVH